MRLKGKLLPPCTIVNISLKPTRNERTREQVQQINTKHTNEKVYARSCRTCVMLKHSETRASQAGPRLAKLGSLVDTAYVVKKIKMLA